MPNDRHRRVARLRTPEERERYALQKIGEILGEGVTTVEEANKMVDSFIKRVAKRIKVVFR